MTALTTTTAQPRRSAPLTVRDTFVAMARAELQAGHSIREVTKAVHAYTPHLPAFQRDVWWCELKHSLAAQDLAKHGLDPWYEDGASWGARVNQALARLAGDER